MYKKADNSLLFLLKKCFLSKKHRKTDTKVVKCFKKRKEKNMKIHKTKIITNINRPNGMVSREVMENLGFKLSEGYKKTGVMVRKGDVVEVFNKSYFDFEWRGSCKKTREELEKVKTRMCNGCYKKVLGKEGRKKYGNYEYQGEYECEICKFKKETNPSINIVKPEEGKEYFEYRISLKKEKFKSEIKNTKEQLEKMEIYLKKKKKEMKRNETIEEALKSFALGFGFDFEEQEGLMFKKMSLKDSLYLQDLKEKTKREENKQLRFEVKFEELEEHEKGYVIWVKVFLKKVKFNK